jgi:hypothetical protein
MMWKYKNAMLQSPVDEKVQLWGLGQHWFTATATYDKCVHDGGQYAFEIQIPPNSEYWAAYKGNL